MPQSNSELMAGVCEGDVIAGKYRVSRVLGAGGMGVVVAAQHLQLKQQVAIKFLLPDQQVGVEVIERFLREAQAAARIRSEHVAGVLDVAMLESGMPYMVMEFLEGRDLGQLLEARGALPVAEAVGYMLEACEGVAEAHAVGIIHRDLKPSNLFLCDRGGGRTTVKVLDFGISKALKSEGAGGSDLTLTKTAAVMGSPLYMSPEQMVSAKNVDARTDIWSLGVSLFELVTGARPFEGDTLTELIANVLQRPPRAARQIIADVSPAFDTALARSLNKEREGRYQNVAEFAAAIAPFGPRHAQMAVERISRALGSAAQIPAGLQATLPAPMQGASAAAVPAARQQPAAFGGGTTATPVLSDVSTERSGLPRRSAAFAVAAFAGAALVLLGVGSTWWIVSHGAFEHRPPPVASAGPSSSLALMTSSSASSSASAMPTAAADPAPPSEESRTPPVPSVLPTASSVRPPHTVGSTIRPPSLKRDPLERRD